MTTKVAPKPRASSLRTVESNNIRCFICLGGIMDFKTQVAGATGLAGLVADALLIVIGSAASVAALDKPLADELTRAIKDGDFECKGGQVLYAHRVPGIKASRVVFVFAAEASVKGLRRAVAAGLAPLKTGGARTLAVATAGFGGLTSAHGQALVMSVVDSLYVYRETKPRRSPSCVR
jgi:leucyl aminopeptidase